MQYNNRNVKVTLKLVCVLACISQDMANNCNQTSR